MCDEETRRNRIFPEHFYPCFFESIKQTNGKLKNIEYIKLLSY